MGRGHVIYYRKLSFQTMAACCLVLELKEKNYILDRILNSCLPIYVLVLQPLSYPGQVLIHDYKNKILSWIGTCGGLVDQAFSRWSPTAGIPSSRLCFFLWISWRPGNGIWVGLLRSFIRFPLPQKFISQFLHVHLIHFLSVLGWWDRRGRPASLLCTDLQ